jgi:hypothetical protein
VLGHDATGRKDKVSIPDVVTGIFHWRNFSGRTMVLTSTGPRTEMGTKNKGGRCVGIANLLSSCAHCLEIWEPHFFRNLRKFPGLCRDCFTLLLVT